MKVLAIVILAVASVSGKGSGPYLPSGWRPQGPAFFLPSEVKPSENPLKDVILAGSEASGSDFLREYGPPKVQEISQNLINQGLPDAVTEQSFEIVPLVVEIKEVAEVVENVEAKTEQTVEQSEAATESVIKAGLTFDLPAVVESDVESTQVPLINDDEASNANVKLSRFGKVISSESLEQNSHNVESSISQESASSSAQESSSSAVEANSEQTSQESLLSQEATVEPQSEVIEKSAQFEVSSDESSVPLAQVSLQHVQNIPDIIASLENEKAQQTEEAVNELAVQAGPDAPEGFLEYGPPGFAEYGPPKGELNEEAKEEKSREQSIEITNETRRRRFSPKFKSSKKHDDFHNKKTTKLGAIVNLEQRNIKCKL